MTLHVELVSAEHKVWAGEAQSVIARTTEGELGILTGHAPLLAILSPGHVRIAVLGQPEVVAEVGEGFLSIEHDRVTVVADMAAVLTGSGTR